MRIFITGAEGFIGSLLAKTLEAEGHHVIRHIWSKEGDLDSGAIPEQSDVIINCAGRLGGQDSSEAEMEEANANLPAALGKFCIERHSTLIHLSTPGVAGLHADSTEKDAYAPWGFYEQTKAKGERALLELGMSNGSLTILRPDFVYGPGDRHKLTLFRQIVKGWFPLIGRGESKLRPTYVGDVCRAVLASLPGGLLNGGLYNIGGPRVVTVRELVDTISSTMGIGVRFIGLPRFLFRFLLLLGPLKPSSLSRSRCRLFGEDHFVSISKASDSGFEPETSLKDGLRTTVKWYRESGLL